MTLTQKETDLLKDLKTQEELCIEKYRRNGESAKSGCLRNLFSSIAETERNHLSTVTKMMNGEEVTTGVPFPAAAPAPTANSAIMAETSFKELQNTL